MHVSVAEHRNVKRIVDWYLIYVLKLLLLAVTRSEETDNKAKQRSHVRACMRWCALHNKSPQKPTETPVNYGLSFGRY